MTLEMLARVLGGVGLFLLGMRLMTEGLKVAAGEALRSILTRSTQTRLRGIASGFLVTALVQSSSAVTVATIGFVNAGLLTLAQAMAVTYGSNIGTTMTGWLVAAIGFHVNIKAFALPLIGIGMALRVASRSGRLGPLGEALAGFGLFFIGIDTLRVAFDGLGGQIELAALAGSGPWRVLLFVALGFGLTLLMQSSSAAIAIVLTAAGGGVVPLGSGAALVIGANLGTTSTAALAVIGATPNARRVAAGHVVFNALTGVVALLLLPFILLLIVKGRELLSLDSEPAAVLAGFHTVFNLLGVALVLPLTDRLIRFLEARFRSAEEDEATPRYLDRNVLAMPRLAFDAMVLELARVGQIARRLADEALGGEKRAESAIAGGQRSLAALVEEIGGYAQRLPRSALPADLDALIPTSLRVSRYYSEAAELAGAIAAGRAAARTSGAAAIDDAIRHFVADARSLVKRAAIEDEAYEAETVAGELASLQESYRQLKVSLLEAGSRGDLPVHDLVATLDWLSNVRRLSEQIERGTRFLASLEVVGAEALEAEPSGTEPLVRSGDATREAP
ncbi:MAG: Na/Pi cotransporter family protein [Myxococcota bacterium]